VAFPPQGVANGQIAESALLASFIAFDPSVTSGVFVTAGDFNHDGRAEVAVSTGTGAPGEVRSFDIENPTVRPVSGPLGDFFPYGAGFLGGITLAAGDVNGDGRAELITGTFRGSSHLKAFDSATGATVLSEFAYPGFTGGFSVSAADLNGDGKAEIITGGAVGAMGHIKVFDGVTGQETSSYFGMGPGYIGGTRVAILGSTESFDTLGRPIDDGGAVRIGRLQRGRPGDHQRIDPRRRHHRLDPAVRLLRGRDLRRQLRHTFHRAGEFAGRVVPPV
jgi:hypothetical protein